ncbi:MAG: hypothetical protein GY832_38350 [Chloroflexi bacterium]|nr:hypothetical protein [Chloroflexota bacterium]
MSRFIVGVFIVLHGLVHLLYSGQSRRLFELQPGMVWPDGAWAFRLVGIEATRLLASIFYALAAAGFVAGGVGLLVKQTWWRPAAIGSAIFSAIIIILFWDGKMQKLADQGLIALLINTVILVALLVLRWPSVGF